MAWGLLFAALTTPLTINLERQNQAFPVVVNISKNSFQLSAISLNQKPDQLTSVP